LLPSLYPADVYSGDGIYLVPKKWFEKEIAAKKKKKQL
jgi:hypothetical protein